MWWPLCEHDTYLYRDICCIRQGEMNEVGGNGRGLAMKYIILSISLIVIMDSNRQDGGVEQARVSIASENSKGRKIEL